MVSWVRVRAVWIGGRNGRVTADRVGCTKVWITCPYIWKRPWIWDSLSPHTIANGFCTWRSKYQTIYMPIYRYKRLLMMHLVCWNVLHTKFDECHVSFCHPFYVDTPRIPRTRSVLMKFRTRVRQVYAEHHLRCVHFINIYQFIFVLPMSMVARTPFRIAHVFDIKVDIKEWVDDDDDDHVRACDIDNND